MPDIQILWGDASETSSNLEAFKLPPERNSVQQIQNATTKEIGTNTPDIQSLLEDTSATVSKSLPETFKSDQERILQKNKNETINQIEATVESGKTYVDIYVSIFYCKRDIYSVSPMKSASLDIFDRFY